MHGEAFDEGPRQSAVLMPGTGKVSIKITSSDPKAQAFFNQGLGQLHGFWYFEAERSFRQVAALDTNCPMAFWGVAMANLNNERRLFEHFDIFRRRNHSATGSRPAVRAASARWPPG